MPTAPRPSFGGFDPSLGAEAPASLDRPFTVPLLIRGIGHRFGIALLLMAGLFFLLALVVQVKKPGDPLVAVCLILGVPCGVGGLINLAWNLPRRRWLEVSRGGFVVSTRKGKVAYQDHQVVGLSFRSKTAGTTRFFVTIETDREDDAPIRCSYVIAPGMVDPLTAFWQRLQQAMIRRIAATLADGASLSGAGWQYDASGLTLTRRRTATVVPVEWIQKAGFFDGHLCLWKDDEALPFAKLPNATRNVLPLATLIWQKIGDSSMTPPLPNEPLGRTVLRRRSADLLLGVGGFLLVGGGIFLAFFSRADSAGLRPGTLPIIVACALLFASPFLVFAVRGLRYGALVFHEWGISQATWGGRRALLYGEIESFCCDGNVRFDFLPSPGSGLRPIRFRHCVRKFDLDVASFVDHLGKIVMARMGRNIQTEPVIWTPRLRFLPSGLEYTARGMFGNSPPVVVPYHLTSYRIVGRRFHLYVTRRPRAVVIEPLAGPNFYPGWYLLQWVYACLQQRPAGTTQPLSQHAPRGADMPPDERFASGERGVTRPPEGGG
jgi:hypothetical protein